MDADGRGSVGGTGFQPVTLHGQNGRATIGRPFVVFALFVVKAGRRGALALYYYCLSMGGKTGGRFAHFFEKPCSRLRPRDLRRSFFTTFFGGTRRRRLGLSVGVRRARA